MSSSSLSRRDFAGSLAAVAASFGASPGSRLEARTAVWEWTPDRPVLEAISVWMEVAAVPAVQMAIVEDGELSWQGSFGVADIRTGEPIGHETMFEAASLTKPVLAYLTLRLVAAGRLDLDCPLVEYTSFDDITGPGLAKVTARHILTHTTGLMNWRPSGEQLHVDAEPGSRFLYSGEGFFVLQRAVEAITNESVEHTMRRWVFDPLGMSASTLVWTPDVEARMAGGHLGLVVPIPSPNYAELGRRMHAIAELWGRPVADWNHADRVAAIPLMNPEWWVSPVYMMPNAAASMFTTASDYAAFLAAMMRAKQAPDPAWESLRESMVTPEVAVNSQLAWGLGWGLEMRNQRTEYFWHWGNNDVFRSFAIGKPADRQAIVIMTNSSNGNRFYQRLVPRLTGADHASLLWFRT